MFWVKLEPGILGSEFWWVLDYGFWALGSRFFELATSFRNNF